MKTDKQQEPVKAKIIVMDDDPLILDVITQMLIYFGHKVLHAKDGNEAIAVFKEHNQSDNQIVDLIIMDLTIPGGMGGKEAVQEILKIDPEAKVIVSSGYSNDPVMTDYQKYGFQAAIEKPFQLAKLMKTINSVLA